MVWWWNVDIAFLEGEAFVFVALDWSSAVSAVGILALAWLDNLSSTAALLLKGASAVVSKLWWWNVDLASLVGEASVVVASQDSVRSSAVLAESILALAGLGHLSIALALSSERAWLWLSKRWWVWLWNVDIASVDEGEASVSSASNSTGGAVSAQWSITFAWHEALWWVLDALALGFLEANTFLSWNTWGLLSKINILWLDIDMAEEVSLLEALLSSASDSLSLAVLAKWSIALAWLVDWVVLLGAKLSWEALVASAWHSWVAVSWVTEWDWGWWLWLVFPALGDGVTIALDNLLGSNLSASDDSLAVSAVSVLANAWLEGLWSKLNASALLVLSNANAFLSWLATNLSSEILWWDDSDVASVVGEALSSEASDSWVSSWAVLAVSIIALAWSDSLGDLSVLAVTLLV